MIKLEDVKASFSQALSVITGFFSELKTLPRMKSYLALAFVLTLFFSVLTFPFDTIIRNEIKKMEGKAFRSMTIGDIDFSIIGSSVIDSVETVLNNNAELSLKNISFNISIIGLLGNTLSGTIDIPQFKYSGTDTSLAGNISMFFDVGIDPAKGVPRSGKAELKLRNLQLRGIKIQGFDIPPVKIATAGGEFLFRNGQIELQRFAVTGADMSAKISGSMLLNPADTSLSQINISVDINSNSGIMKNYKMFLMPYIDQSTGSLVLVITGTLKDPQVNFNKTAPTIP